jgi:uncharacterized membrane protein (DUF4010 family)
MTKKHPTPLSIHLKDRHLWFDTFVLVILWILVLIKPFSIDAFILVNKVLAIVATLELVSFLLFHLLGHKKSLLLQGFIGGFISSTAIFMQLNFDKRFAHTDQIFIAQALILANCSMLIECILIAAALSTDFSFLMLLPFFTMLFSLFIAHLVLNYFKSNEATDNEKNISLEADHPILWKKVMLYSFYISILKFIFGLIHNYSKSSDFVATFLASLLEAHAILAVVVTNNLSISDFPQFLKMVGIILIGSTLSKLFFVLRGKNLKRKSFVILPMMLSLVLALILVSYLTTK